MATLRIGTLDLSRYLDVQQGDGMDPAAPGYSNRVLSHGLLREGGIYALEDKRTKELVFPLYLTAVTKDGLHALVQQINLALALDGQTATWQDDNAFSATIFDLATGQLDIEYDFRRAQNNYLHAKLRLFAQPFGRRAAPLVTATYSATGAGPVVTLVSASPIGGDVNALAIASIFAQSNAESVFYGSVSRTAAFSVLPGPSYAPIYNASSFTSDAVKGPILAEAGAVASVFRRRNLSAVGDSLDFRAAIVYLGSQYTGDNRVLCIVRPNGPSQFLATTSWPTIPIWISDGRGNTTATLALSFPSGSAGSGSAATHWRIYDLGVVTVVPDQQPTAALTLWSTICSNPSYALDITALIVLPDDKTVWLQESNRMINGGDPDYGWRDVNSNDTYAFNGASSTIMRHALSGGSYGYDVTTYSRGAIPQAAAGATAYFAALVFPANDSKQTVSVAVIERTRYVF